MSHKAVKIVITGAVMAIAFGALLYTSLGDNLQYYKYVDEVVAQPAEWQGKPLKVHGYVVNGSIHKKPSSREYRFQVQNKGKVLTAYYTGTVPDGFQNESEVVMTGVLKDHETFVANDMQAKCPSKYEERASEPKVVTDQQQPSPADL
jgi:cytochrome c-type biogenesis protein CcmE